MNDINIQYYFTNIKKWIIYFFFLWFLIVSIITVFYAFKLNLIYGIVWICFVLFVFCSFYLRELPCFSITIKKQNDLIQEIIIKTPFFAIPFSKAVKSCSNIIYKNIKNYDTKIANKQKNDMLILRIKYKMIITINKKNLSHKKYDELISLFKNFSEISKIPFYENIRNCL